MPRTSIVSLAAAAVFAFVPLAAQAQAGKKPPLPAGPGREVVEAVCTTCHQTDMITNSSGYTREQWKELTGFMIDLSPAPDIQSKILDYLAAHFPPSYNRRPAKQVSGPVEISFKEWQTPTLGQRTRDPIEAPDGTIWWVGQFGNILGHLNPTTGEMKEYKLPPGSFPHTVELDHDGIPWFTGNKNATIGKLDPATGKFTVYKMPDPRAKDPHTLVFDQKGIAWFSLQNSNMIGRLDPRTGEIRVVMAPSPKSKPYGVKIAADGTPWVACNGRPCLIKVNPLTMALTEIKLPFPGTTVRRLDIAADGIIWYVNSGKGQLGSYNPKTGEIKEWPSPSGPKSHPYAIVVIDGIVWYNESGVRPDMLVRFDPKTETFQSWPIPSGRVFAGIWRHGRATHDGNLLIHQTATNRIIRVTIKRRAAAR